jgi:hypothetical protein
MLIDSFDVPAPTSVSEALNEAYRVRDDVERWVSNNAKYAEAMGFSSEEQNAKLEAKVMSLWNTFDRLQTVAQGSPDETEINQIRAYAEKVAARAVKGWEPKILETPVLSEPSEAPEPSEPSDPALADTVNRLLEME